MARRRFSGTPDIAFDPRLGGTGRYVDRRTGRIVSQSFVDDALELQIQAAQKSINGISRQLANSEITLAEWQLAMRDQMKTIHTISGALSKGGWGNMSQADWGAVGRISRIQYAKLEDVAVKIFDGKIRLRNLSGDVNGTFLRIADLFGQGGIQTRSQMERRIAVQNGAELERRVLDARAQHCDCCIEQAGLGWQPVGTLEPIGNCTCDNNCRCHFEYGQEVSGERVAL